MAVDLETQRAWARTWQETGKALEIVRRAELRALTPEKALRATENLLAVHGRAMDLRRVRAVVADFAAVLEDGERPAILERLLRQAGLG